MDILSKKMLLDMPNAAVKCNDVYGEISSLKTVPAELSLCVTLKITAEQYAAASESVNILGSVNGISWFNLIRRRYSESNDRIQWEYKNSNLMSSSVAAAYYANYTPVITDGQPHKLVCCVSATEKQIKAFLDGVLIGTADLSATPPAEFTATNPFRVGTLSNYPLAGGWALSNVKYFNFDISAAGAPYTLDDYQNNRDVPDALSSAYIVSPDKVYPTVDSVTNTTPSVWMRGDNSNLPSISYTASKQLKITISGAGSIYNTLIKFILPRTLKENEPITFNFMGDGTQTASSTADAGLLVYCGKYESISQTNLSGSGKLLCNGSHTFDAHPATNYIMLYLPHNADFPEVAGAVYTFPQFSVSVAGEVLNLHNKLSGTTWTDESGNANNMTLSGDYEITDE